MEQESKYYEWCHGFNGYIGRVVVLPDGKRTTQLQHRVVMEDHLGRSLRSDAHVHHINEDKSDNRVENLSVMSASDHAKEHSKERHQEVSHLVCCYCSVAFDRPTRFVRHSEKQGKFGPFCSRSCAGKWSAAKQNSSPDGKMTGAPKKLTLETAGKILARAATGESLSSIARDFDVSRSTVRDMVAGKCWVRARPENMPN